MDVVLGFGCFIFVVGAVSLISVLSIYDYSEPIYITPIVITQPISAYPTRLPTQSKQPTSRQPTTFTPSRQPTTFVPTLPTTSPTASPTGNPFYAIDVTYAGVYSTEIYQSVNDSILSWQRTIAQSLPTYAIIPASSAYCGYTFYNETIINDLRIHINIRVIDGIGGVLGSAGPCIYDENNMPRFGVINMDSADVNGMIVDGTLTDVFRHEIGHVLGIGTLWTPDITYSATSTGVGYPYLLTHANAAHVELAGSGVALVEDTGGGGTLGSHWKEAYYDTELMTGYIDVAGFMPLSSLTVGALRDLGYVVNMTNAEPYSIPPTGRRLRKARHIRAKNCTKGLPKPTRIYSTFNKH